MDDFFALKTTTVHETIPQINHGNVSKNDFGLLKTAQTVRTLDRYGQQIQ